MVDLTPLQNYVPTFENSSGAAYDFENNAVTATPANPYPLGTLNFGNGYNITGNASSAVSTLSITVANFPGV